MKRKTFFALAATVAVAAAALLPIVLPLGNQGFGTAMAASNTPNADLIKRGEYLARAADCMACHTVRGGKFLAGGYALPTPFGTLFTPNLTPDDETGLGKWTSDDFYRAMHTGRAKDGSLLYPAFPFTSYTKMTRPDTDAIFAYLRSVPPVHQENRPNELRFPFNNRNLLIGWRTLFFREGEFQPDATKSAEWNRGAYLVEGPGHCAMCHTSINPLGGANSGAAFAGGLIPLQNWYAPSLTSDKEAGLGSWNTQDIVDLLKTGVSSRGAVFGPMAEVVHNSLQYLSDSDVRAMAVFLQTLPRKEAPEILQLETSEKFGQALLGQGKKVYADNCAKCHGIDGAGQPPAFPPLATNQSIQMPSAVNPIRMVLNGGYPPATKGNPEPHGMPPFAQALSNQEIAAVVTYVRQTWGNKGTAVSPQQVDNLRSAPLD
ncbi:MAG: c-type cytochrome [Janthinobacterium lividum]